MVWQTAKWLSTNDVWHIAVNQFNHFTCEKPSLTGLVTVRYERFCIFSQYVNLRWCLKTFALSKCFAVWLAELI